MVSVMIFVPNRSLHGVSAIVMEEEEELGHLCARNLSIISGPVTPSGNPGKFSTCEIVLSSERHLDCGGTMAHVGSRGELSAWCEAVWQETYPGEQNKQRRHRWELGQLFPRRSPTLTHPFASIP